MCENHLCSLAFSFALASGDSSFPAARTGRLGEPGFVVLSSRGSHELVRKCAKVGIAALATISAPTAMGVRMAELTGLRFWGLCRPPKAVLYAGDGKA